jgi:hypothetical protein
VCFGQQEVAAGGPRAGAVAQAPSGEGVEVLGEAMGFAQGAEVGAEGSFVEPVRYYQEEEETGQGKCGG